MLWILIKTGSNSWVSPVSCLPQLHKLKKLAQRMASGIKWHFLPTALRYQKMKSWCYFQSSPSGQQNISPKKQIRLKNLFFCLFSHLLRIMCRGIMKKYCWRQVYLVVPEDYNWLNFNRRADKGMERPLSDQKASFGWLRNWMSKELMPFPKGGKKTKSHGIFGWLFSDHQI